MENYSNNPAYEAETLTDIPDGFSVPVKKGGKVSAVIRLLLMSGCNIGAISLFLYGIFRKTEMTPWEQFTDAFACCAFLTFFGVWLWGFVKWVVVATPKTYRATKAIVHRIIPLSLFAFFVEIMIGLWLILLPYSLYTMTLMPILRLVDYVDAHLTNITIPLIMLAVSAAASYFLAKMDLVKIFGDRRLRTQSE